MLPMKNLMASLTWLRWSSFDDRHIDAWRAIILALYEVVTVMFELVSLSHFIVIIYFVLN